MTAPPETHLTVSQYLDLDRVAEWRSEFHDGIMYPVARSSRAHSFINENLVGELHARLGRSNCRTLSRTQRVAIGRTGLYCHPDLVIVCGPPEYSSEDPDTLVNPRVVVGVLSDSTERYDRTTKFRHYQQLPSVMEYVLVSQEEPMCERFGRQADGTWTVASFVGLDAALVLTSVPIQVPLADIFAGVAFPDPPPR